MANILVVDDEVGIRELLSEILSDEGHTVRLAENASTAREARGRERPDLVLLDIWMPDTDGISLLKDWSASGQLNMPVVMMSGHATIDTAVEATRIGAMDFLEKPIAMQKLLATVKRALRTGETPTHAPVTLVGIGHSSAIADVRKRLAQLAQSSAPLLLRGEPGLVPEPYARLLVPPGGPFVLAAQRLAEAPQDLLAQASGGVAFVDELATLTKPQQRGLAFVASRAERHRVRIVSFTAEDPRRLVEERGFEQPLLVQLAQLVLALPALRQCAGDIPELAMRLLAQLVETRACAPRRFSDAALAKLQEWTWPRNVEELQQVVRSVALAALGSEIGPEDLERVMLVSRAAGPQLGDLSFDQPLREAREAFERAYFEHHLGRDASMTRLAERSGLERTHLYRKLRALGIQSGRREE